MQIDFLACGEYAVILCNIGADTADASIGRTSRIEFQMCQLIYVVVDRFVKQWIGTNM